MCIGKSNLVVPIVMYIRKSNLVVPIVMYIGKSNLVVPIVMKRKMQYFDALLKFIPTFSAWWIYLNHFGGVFKENLSGT